MTRRLYFFELFTLANFLVLHLVLRRIGFSAFTLLGQSFLFFVPALLLQVVVGAGIRAAAGRRRGDGYLAAILTPRFISDTVRIIFSSVLWAHVYGWLKVTVPRLNPRLYDQALWDIDRVLCFGMSPNVLFVDLFSHPATLHAVDWTYANVFAAALFIGGAVFFSSADARLRIGFVNAVVALWLIGAWLYLAVPSLGPCYGFPSLWLPLAPHLPQTNFLQRMLMTNYQTFIHLAPGRPEQISLLLGIGAFPSLHVACAFMTFLWLRGQGRGWRILLAFFTLIIFIGSIVTGWHYLVDSLAGLLLAALCYAAFRLLPSRFERHVHSD